MRECGKGGEKCASASFNLDTDDVLGDCCDWVFGIRWKPEEFLRQAVDVGHPFTDFSGLPMEVREACKHVAESDYFVVINNRCSKLGEWLRLSKTFQKEEEEVKAALPGERRKIWRRESYV